MFRNKTVFVVGAGASCELGLPSGDSLMPMVSNYLAPDQLKHGFNHNAMIQPLVQKARKLYTANLSDVMRRYRDKADQVCRALPYARSIDTYLESQRDDEEIVFLGKLAIAQAILQSERSSHLGPGSGEDADASLAKSWYPPLARILTAGRHAGDVLNLFHNISFIVFNYDRCLELFLLRMIRNYFGVGDEAAKVLASATIIHAYGQAGSLIYDDHYVPFGETVQVDLGKVASGLRTYTEATDEGTTTAIRALIRDAHTIVFMGYGYLAQNMKLITPLEDSRVRQVFATTYGLSPQDREAVREKLVQSLGKTEMIWSGATRIPSGKQESFRLTFEEGKCRNLMENNVFSLADQ